MLDLGGSHMQIGCPEGGPSWCALGRGSLNDQAYGSHTDSTYKPELAWIPPGPRAEAIATQVALK